MKMFIDQFRQAAIAAAIAKEDPAKFALSLLDRVPRIYYEPIVDMIDPDDWFETLFKGDAKATEHRAWITQVRDAILAEFPEEEEKTEAPGRG